ncbi:MAG: BON domain-containing protein [Blastocatellia bacterium]|nr:BON domain-containing protein [Blastocatellia bacterium]MBK6425524.1 BON domain-containing protein [Blastocatellia bacterium]
MTRTMTAIAALCLAMGFSACGSDADPRNANPTANANRAANVNRATKANSNGDGQLTREDFDREKDRIAKEAKDLGRKVGNGADDLWIWTKTRAALATEDDLRDSTINVDVDNNVVTVSGSVASIGQKARAESIARGIVGVKSVTNLLKVGAVGAVANTNARPKS